MKSFHSRSPFLGNRTFANSLPQNRRFIRPLRGGGKAQASPETLLCTAIFIPPSAWGLDCSALRLIKSRWPGQGSRLTRPRPGSFPPFIPFLYKRGMGPTFLSPAVRPAPAALRPSGRSAAAPAIQRPAPERGPIAGWKRPFGGEWGRKKLFQKNLKKVVDKPLKA